MVKAIARAALAGGAATAAMTAVMYLGKALGLLRQPPPKQITATAERKAGSAPSKGSKAGFTVLWAVAHAGYGMAAGLPYLLLRKIVPGPSALLGVGYGVALWVVSYFKLLPALGLFPRPGEDSRSRSAVMVTAHIVYGGVLARLAGGWRSA